MKRFKIEQTVTFYKHFDLFYWSISSTYSNDKSYKTNVIIEI